MDFPRLDTKQAGVSTPPPSDGAAATRAVGLSFVQREIWDQARSQPGGDRNLTILLQLTGTIDAAALERALADVVRLTPSLRSAFRESTGSAMRIIGEPLTRVVIQHEDLRATNLVEATAAARRRVAREAQISLDATKPPLIRASLLRHTDHDHFLILTVHPLACDGASLVLLVRQLFAGYRAALAGRRVSRNAVRVLDDQPLRIGNAAVETNEGLAHWRKHFAQPFGTLDLPLDQTRGGRGGFKQAEVTFSLSRTVVSALWPLAENAARMEDIFLAAFEVMLHSYSGGEAFGVGVPAVERHQSGERQQVGRFSCFLPVCASPQKAHTFRTLIAASCEASRSVRRHAGPAYEIVRQEAEQGRRGTSTGPFAAAFALRRGWSRPFQAGGLTVTPLALDGDLPPCELALEIQKDDSDVAGRLVYNASLFQPATAYALAAHYQSLLANLATNPDLPLMQVPLVSAAEAHHIRHDWNQTRADYPTGFCLHELFEKQAGQTPDAVALVHEDRELSYAELNRRADGLAAILRQRGVGRDVPVAVSVEPSFEMIVGLLGVLKAGGAYVPVDPASPPERLQFLLDDTRAPVLLTQRHLLPGWPTLKIEALLLDGLAAEEAGEQSFAKPTPNHLAYIIYTSGSTGTPKGVMVPHESIASTLHWRQDTFPLGPNDRVLQTFSFTFDASVWELFAPLLAGARLVLTSTGVARDSTKLVDLIAHHGITAMQTIPSRLGLLLEERGLDRCGTLRHVICGGEAMTGALQEKFFAKLPHTALHNLYGPTETSLDATFWTCCRGDGKSAIPIGRPIANKRVYLLDRHMRMVPPGVAGELFIGGAGLARGYLNNPQLTAERFLADLFAPGSGERVYRTGDLCRWLPDGSLLFLGRTDQQVKIRGFRIEPGEIETALARHPAVRQAVVVARADAGGEARLVAYVVAAEGTSPTPLELRQSLRGRLPEYMIPSAVVLLPELPRTATGKVDVKSLPAPNAPIRRTCTEPLSDPVERFLAGLWEDVLGIKGVNTDDDFFDLGGTSLKVAVLIHCLQDKLGEYVYTVALYDAPTLGGLARYLRINYPTAITKLFGREALNGCVRGEKPVDDARIALARDLVKRLPPRASANGKKHAKNPRAVFVLSPPRSGSTLFRVLLGGHPQLFAPPELQLLNFDTLAERHAAFDTERDRFWLDGTVRAIMEAKRCDADEATRIMEDCERRGLTVKEFYRLVQSWLGDSIFVDKTPTYAMDPHTLQRAEEDFEDPLFIHLIRHPSPMISSFEEAKLHVFFPPFFRAPTSFGVTEMAEMIWHISHRNILDFLAKVPSNRRTEVRFEELVKKPNEVMSGVSKFLGIPFHTAMTDPFRQDHKSRMTDGLHSMARMLGDVKFHEHKGIEAQAAERKKGRFPEEKLGKPTREMAKLLGYTIREPEANGHVPSRNGHAERAGPRCMIRIQPGVVGRRPLFCIHPAGGTATCYGELARHLGEEQPVFGFQAPGVAGERPRPVRLEGLAARYIEEMRSAQPEGPYQIAGWSVGGVISFEMTRQLAAQGQDVSLLTLFDSDIPRQTERMRKIDPELVLAELARPYGLDTRAGGLIGEARLQAIVEQARDIGLIPADFTTLQLRRLFRHHARVFRANVRAVRRYTPVPSGRPMLLFRPVDRSITAVTGPKLDWADFASEVTTVTVPGDHFSMMREPNIRVLAEQLKSYLHGSRL